MEGTSQDPITLRAIELMQAGQAQGRPAYTAARLIVAEETAAREEFLEARAAGVEGPPSPGLFPLNVFKRNFKRRTYTNTGRPVETAAEARMNFELSDSQGF